MFPKALIKTWWIHKGTFRKFPNKEYLVNMLKTLLKLMITIWYANFMVIPIPRHSMKVGFHPCTP